MIAKLSYSLGETLASGSEQMRIDRRTVSGAAIAALFWKGEARAQDCPLSVEVDNHGWTGLEAWTDDLKPMLPLWWRDINRALGAPACRADKTIRLEFYRLKPDYVAAAARGDRVLINAPYVLANRGKPDMFRMIAHELVHIAQAYPEGAGPAWMTEGIADYVRYYVLFPDDPGRAFDPGQEDWREGYSPAAGLLAWADAKWPGTLARVNAAMRGGDKGDVAFAAATGATPAVLWRAYLRTAPSAASAAKRRAYWESLKRGGD